MMVYKDKIEFTQELANLSFYEIDKVGEMVNFEWLRDLYKPYFDIWLKDGEIMLLVNQYLIMKLATKRGGYTPKQKYLISTFTGDGKKMFRRFKNMKISLASYLIIFGERFVKSNQHDFYKSREWRELRFDALAKYGHKCVSCGASPSTGAILHVDHIKPRSRFPDLQLDINNLQILCDDCNIGKSNRYSTRI